MAILTSSSVSTTNRAPKLLNMAGENVSSLKDTMLIKIYISHTFCILFVKSSTSGTTVAQPDTFKRFVILVILSDVSGMESKEHYVCARITRKRRLAKDIH